MARRGTTLAINAGSLGVTGVQRRKIRYAIDFVNTADVTHNGALGGGGANAMELVGAVGKASTNGYAVLGLDMLTTDTLDVLWGDIYDVDLTAAIYFDIIWGGVALETGEVATIAGSYDVADYTPAAANQLDYAGLAAMSGSASVTMAAANAGNLNELTGLYIPSNTLTDNEGGIITRFTATFTNVAAAEFTVYAARMRYTGRAGY